MIDASSLGKQTFAFKLTALLMLAAGISVIDTLTDLEIAIGVFHIAVVLIAMSFMPPKGVISIAGMCMMLTIVSYQLTASGSSDAGLINCGISLAAIAATTYLALRMSAAISSAHEARAHLAQIARVNVLGELTTSIAHEVNQPLAAIVTSGDACRRWMTNHPPNLDKARQAIGRMIDDANRASQIIARVRGLARRDPPVKEWLNVADVINEILSLVSGELDQQAATLRLDIPEGLPPILADRVQIQQVLLNLIVNALDALRGVDDSSRRELELIVEHTATGHISFSICDCGVGLAEDSERLFDAFFTTKTEGMGIGLTICRSIVEAHGGRIWATANVTRGTIFHFSLPASRRDLT